MTRRPDGSSSNNALTHNRKHDIKTECTNENMGQGLLVQLSGDNSVTSTSSVILTLRYAFVQLNQNKHTIAIPTLLFMVYLPYVQSQRF